MRTDISLALVLVGALSASMAMAFTAPEQKQQKAFGLHKSTPIGMRVLRPATAQATAEQFTGLKGKGNLIVEADQLTGAARVISGGTLIDTVSLKGSRDAADFVDQAMGFVAESSALLGVDASDLSLVKDAVFIDKDVQFFKFAVSRGGLVILDAGLDFRFKQGRLIQVANQTFAEAGADGRPSLGGLDRIAQAAIAATDVSAKGEAYRVVATKDGYDLVRVALFEAIGMGGEHYDIQVEAATGEVFEISPRTLHLNGSASGEIYNRYYVETPVTAGYQELNLVHAGGNVRTGTDGTFRDAPNGSTPKLDGFIGAKVKVNLMTGTKVVRDGSQVRDEWHVVYQRGVDPVDNDKNMAQSMVYYHLNKMIILAKSYIQTPWLDQQLTANVNLSQTCNAHWDGSTVNFYSGGGGCANTALISDVMYHEWGHGLDAKTGGIADGGFSEGFGDIMSMINTESHILGIGFRTDGSPVRDLEPNKVYPADAGGGVHSEGLIIGSTFWDLFKALRDTHGREVALDLVRKYSLKGIFTAARYTDMYNAILVIDDDNGDLTDETPNFCTINAQFAAHGLATLAESCNLAAVDQIEVDDTDRGNGNGILEPGETADLWITARNSSANALNDLTGVLAVNGNAAVTVTDANVSWGAIPARSPRRSDDAATVSIAGNAQCGSRFNAVVGLAGNGRTASITQSVAIGQLVTGNAENFNATGLPLPIRDNATTAVPVSVAGSQWDATAEVQVARLAFDITHTYVGDLTVKLVAPNGTAFEVFRGSGSGDDVHFDQDVSALLTGVRGAGNWRLDVTDSASQDVGSVTRVALSLTPGRFSCN